MSIELSNVISLSSAFERRQHITHQFSQQHIPFQFFDAISPSPLFDQLISELFPHLADAHLTNGEKGCFLSHLSLWHKCVEKNLPYLVIFEDDICLGKDADTFFMDDKWLFARFNPEDIFIIRLETFLQKVSYELTDIEPHRERQFLKLKSTHFGTAGYIISLGAAKFLLAIFNKMKVDEIAPIDELIFNKFLEREDFTVYQLSPAICIQELQLNKNNAELQSQLEYERSKIRRTIEIKKRDKTFGEKMIWFFSKPKRMLDRKRTVIKGLNKKSRCDIVEFK